MLLKAMNGFAKNYSSDVFILGAGFSRAISQTMPNLKDLSNRIVPRAAHPREDILPVGADDNVELALEFLSRRQPWLAQAEYYSRLAQYHRVLEAISGVIDTAEHEATQQSKCPDWLLQLVYWMHDEQATIITLNYDTLLERAFQLIEVADFEDDHNPTTLHPLWLYPREFAFEPLITPPLWPTAQVLKLHGSLNWFYSGATEFFGETIQCIRPPEWPCKYRWSKPESKVPLVAPPLSDKSSRFAHEGMHHQWKVARKTLRQAKRLFCIGFSFPDTDLAIRFLLRDGSPVADCPLFLIDLDESLISKVKTFLPKSFVLNLSFFGAAWNEKLLSCLWRERPKVSQPGSVDEQLKKAIGARIAGVFQPGAKVGLPDGTQTCTVSMIDDRGLVLVDDRLGIPMEVTWDALAVIVTAVRTPPYGLPVRRQRGPMMASSVESLMQPWYARRCGRLVAELLLRANIVESFGRDSLSKVNESVLQLC